ncbi:DUF4097 family beta strand repeat-containing protein [Streptomyces anulatus]|uniref:DUF4097 family beta strand repeat-containing protein n=1 Tax=Streptomyces anulatus TaxID=1892 RepID=UPI000539B6A4|nr:DUF4097 family beta strand repeat-containing protein [Streptomyces anulatus]
MSSEKIHVMTTDGAVELDLSVSGGTVNVTVDPKAVHGRIRVHTSDTEGPVADAVNDTKITERGNELTVSVPDDEVGGISGTNVVQVNGSRYSFNSVVNTGTMTGMTIRTTVRGDLETIRFDARNGSLQAGGVKVLEAETHNGSVLVDTVETELEASTHNGSITIGAYNGRRGSARTHNGDVTISATPAASGRLAARTHNGNIRVRGAGHLDLKTSTHNGRIW